MIYRCDDCGEIFDEDEAEVEDYDIEAENGVGWMFTDHHIGSMLVCPECRSSDISEYFEEEEEEDDEDETE